MCTTQFDLHGKLIPCHDTVPNEAPRMRLSPADRMRILGAPSHQIKTIHARGDLETDDDPASLGDVAAGGSISGFLSGKRSIDDEINDIVARANLLILPVGEDDQDAQKRSVPAQKVHKTRIDSNFINTLEHISNLGFGHLTIRQLVDILHKNKDKKKDSKGQKNSKNKKDPKNKRDDPDDMSDEEIVNTLLEGRDLAIGSSIDDKIDDIVTRANLLVDTSGEDDGEKRSLSDDEVLNQLAARGFLSKLGDVFNIASGGVLIGQVVDQIKNKKKDKKKKDKREEGSDDDVSDEEIMNAVLDRRGLGILGGPLGILGIGVTALEEVIGGKKKKKPKRMTFAADLD